jgi:pimeloyl-ACP methyl ester carboxylesterase
MRLHVAIIVLVLGICGQAIASEPGAPQDTEAAFASKTFTYRDGGTAIYHTFVIGKDTRPEVAVFFYGGSGCRSWASVMPGYVKGLDVNARVFALDKRFVVDSPGASRACGNRFKEMNTASRWVADDLEFITSQLATAPVRPKKVLLVGVSEGALVAPKVATLLPEVTHLAIIGAGAWTMRESLRQLYRTHVVPFDVDAEWKNIESHRDSLEREWFGNPYRWWADVMDISAAADLLKLDIPILVGFGERDTSVPVESALALKSAFDAEHKTNLTLIVYPGADHRLDAGPISYKPRFFDEVSKCLQR